jgi:hypothetical protein
LWLSLSGFYWGSASSELRLQNSTFLIPWRDLSRLKNPKSQTLILVLCPMKLAIAFLHGCELRIRWTKLSESERKYETESYLAILVAAKFAEVSQDLSQLFDFFFLRLITRVGLFPSFPLRSCLARLASVIFLQTNPEPFAPTRTVRRTLKAKPSAPMTANEGAKKSPVGRSH